MECECIDKLAEFMEVGEEVIAAAAVGLGLEGVAEFVVGEAEKIDGAEFDDEDVVVAGKAHVAMAAVVGTDCGTGIADGHVVWNVDVFERVRFCDKVKECCAFRVGEGRWVLACMICFFFLQ